MRRPVEPKVVTRSRDGKSEVEAGMGSGVAWDWGEAEEEGDAWAGWVFLRRRLGHWSPQEPPQLGLALEEAAGAHISGIGWGAAVEAGRGGGRAIRYCADGGE